MRTIFQISTFIFFVILIVKCKKENHTVVPPVDLLDHSISEYEVYDKPIKTQITMKVLINDTAEVSNKKLEELLMFLYNKEMSKTSFQYHNPPNAIYMYAYLTKQKLDSGTGYVSMLMKAYDDTAPKYEFKAEELSLPKENSGSRWGLSHNDRLKIWDKLILAERKAESMADETYPPDSPSTSYADLQKNGKLRKELTSKFELEIASEYSLSKAILDSIGIEGLNYSWPFPPE